MKLGNKQKALGLEFKPGPMPSAKEFHRPGLLSLRSFSFQASSPFGTTPLRYLSSAKLYKGQTEGHKVPSL